MAKCGKCRGFGSGVHTNCHGKGCKHCKGTGRANAKCTTCGGSGQAPAGKSSGGGSRYHAAVSDSSSDDDLFGDDSDSDGEFDMAALRRDLGLSSDEGGTSDEEEEEDEVAVAVEKYLNGQIGFFSDMMWGDEEVERLTDILARSDLSGTYNRNLNLTANFRLRDAGFQAVMRFLETPAAARINDLDIFYKNEDLTKQHAEQLVTFLETSATPN